MTESTDTIDIIVRIHAPDRLFELSRCLMSLVAQDYAPARVHLVLQRFALETVRLVENMASEMGALNEEISFQITNFHAQPAEDARSYLLNLGIAQCSGKYLAFLDYDDTIYPHIYSSLIKQMKISKAAIAFCGVAAALADVTQGAILTRRKEMRFSGSGLLGLFVDNHCPIHGLVIDRTQIANEHLFFKTDLARLEDYDFLLRICARYRSDFTLKNICIADYFLKSDDSNTVVHDASQSSANQKAWDHARAYIAQLRTALVVSLEALQSDATLHAKAPTSIASLLKGLTQKERSGLSEREQALIGDKRPVSKQKVFKRAKGGLTPSLTA